MHAIPSTSEFPLVAAAAYLARVALRADELARQPHLRLRTGMPAEVFIATPARTLLEYLLEPLGAFARRALREP